MNSNSQYPADRAPGREHIPIYPKGFIALRIVQLVLAVLILGLSAYGISAIPTSGNVFILVVAIFTLATSTYYLVCEYNAPNAYNYWAVLSLDIFMIIMWLASFALLASEVSFLFSILDYYDYYSSTDSGIAIPSCMAAAAGLGGIQFALHIVSLAIHSVRMHRHRAAGLHCTPGAPRTLPTTNGTAAPAPISQAPTGEKFAQAYPPQPYPAPQPYPPQQPYPVQQPYPPQPQPQPQPQPHMPYPPQQPMPVYAGQPLPYGGIPQELPPVQYYPQGQVPIPSQPTGSSYSAPQPYYQQGPAVPLFSQPTGGSISQQPPAQPAHPQPQPAQTHQGQQTELPTSNHQS